MIIFSISAVSIFAISVWAVFSKHFCDGIISKHLLAFAAITAMLVIRDPDNSDAMLASLGLFAAAFTYWFLKHYRQIRARFNPYL